MASGNPKCANCMVSCGYEPSAVIDGFGTLSRASGAWCAARSAPITDQHALKLLNEPMPHGPSSLVQISRPAAALEETNA